MLNYLNQSPFLFLFDVGQHFSFNYGFCGFQVPTHGWYEEALIGMFMGRLTMEIAEAVRMFKPQSLKDVISLVRMKDGQVLRMKKSHPACPNGVTQKKYSNATLKRLTWDEMQLQRAVHIGPSL